MASDGSSDLVYVEGFTDSVPHDPTRLAADASCGATLLEQRDGVIEA